MLNKAIALPDHCLTELEEKYRSLKRRGAEQWDEEKSSLQELLPLIHDSISPRYVIRGGLGVGGIGIVLKVEDTNLKMPCALKFPRPTSGRESLFPEVLESEIAQLLKARHPNIIEVYYQGRIDHSGRPWPYYVMELIPNAVDGLEYFEQHQRDGHQIVVILRQVVDGLCHLHRLGIMHGDVKLENMLIASDGRAVLSDLGSARNLREGPAEVTVIFTRDWAHPRLRALVSYAASTDPNRLRGPVHRNELQTSFDLYALGQNVRRLLHLHDPAEWKGLEPYERKYLQLMGTRLLDGHNGDHECALGLPRTAYEEIKYAHAEEVATDLRKLTGEFPLRQIVPELDLHPIRTIQTSSLSPTPLTSSVSQILDHRFMNRLASVSQLGLVSLVYPTASHSRFEHVLGTFSNTVRYCEALYNDPVNPLFRQLVTADDLKAVLAAALLHDVMQYPLAHDLEEVQPDLFSHEDLATDLLLESGKDLPDVRSLRRILEVWGTTLQRVLAIINADPTALQLPIKDRLLHTILDSPIDADKLDYLVRDSGNLNVPFGFAIDFERLLQCVTVVFKEEQRRMYVAVGIHEKGRIPAETMAFARYAMFGAVYWHHTVRATKAMFHRAVWETLRDPANARLLAEEFGEFVLGVNMWGEQGHLFASERQPLSVPTRLSPGDREVLEWFAARTSPHGRELITMLLGRGLYKRIGIGVISAAKNYKLWNRLVRFSANGGWTATWQLQLDIQRRIVDLVRNLEPERRTTSILDASRTDAVIAMHERGVPLALVDIPSGRPGTQISLEYLPESDRKQTMQEWREPLVLEDSVVWNQLYDKFLEAVGKVRVFCHPDVSDTIEAALSRKDLEDAIQASLQQLEKPSRRSKA